MDGKTDQTAATNAASKLVDVDKVVAIAGFSDSNYALAAGPIAQNAGVPFVTSGATLPSLPEQVGDYSSWRLSVTTPRPMWQLNTPPKT